MSADPLRGMVERILRAHFGDERFVDYPRTGMGAEDFPYFTTVEPPIPGLYFVVGGTDQAAFDAAQAGGPPIPGHHSPFFKIEPEPSIKLAIASSCATWRAPVRGEYRWRRHGPRAE